MCSVLNACPGMVMNGKLDWAFEWVIIVRATTNECGALWLQCPLLVWLSSVAAML